jgi:uncharacterized protein (DUF362 family)
MPDVALLECDSYETKPLIDALNEGAALLGGWERFARPGMRVLLKINLIGPKPPESAAVTHCEFVRALVRILKGRGCEVWIGDSAGGAIAGIAPTDEGMEVSGMARVAAEEGASIKNFERCGSRAVAPEDAPGRVYNLAKPAFEADLVINLPKLKTHSAAVYTGAVKNLFGLVPGLRKAEYHRSSPSSEAFGTVIADINKCLRPALHIMDGIIAMQGAGPTAGTPYPAKKILMGTDPLALDAVACAMLGLDLGELPMYRDSLRRGIGEWRLSSIRLLGPLAAIPRLAGFKIPRELKVGRLMGKLFGRMIDMMKKRPVIELSACVDCGTCVESCPVQAIDRATKAIDYSICIECLCCHELCIHEAVRLRRVKKARASGA